MSNRRKVGQMRPRRGDRAAGDLCRGLAFVEDCHHARAPSAAARGPAGAAAVAAELAAVHRRRRLQVAWTSTRRGRRCRSGGAARRLSSRRQRRPGSRRRRARRAPGPGRWRPMTAATRQGTGRRGRRRAAPCPGRSGEGVEQFQVRRRAAELVGQVGVRRKPGRAIRQVRRDPAEDLRQSRLDMPVLLGVGGQLAPGQRPRLPAAVKRVIQQALAADPRPDKTGGLRNMQWHGRNASISGPRHQGHAPAPAPVTRAGPRGRSGPQKRHAPARFSVASANRFAAGHSSARTVRPSYRRPPCTPGHLRESWATTPGRQLLCSTERVITRCTTRPMRVPGATIRAMPGDLEPLPSPRLHGRAGGGPGGSGGRPARRAGARCAGRWWGRDRWRHRTRSHPGL